MGPRLNVDEFSINHDLLAYQNQYQEKGQMLHLSSRPIDIFKDSCPSGMGSPLNNLPSSKILDWSKLKAFAYSKLKVAHMIKLLLERVKVIVGKGENSAYRHFCPFPTMISKPFFFRIVKSQDCVVKG